MALVVLGAERACKALRIWRSLVADVGLIMAAPEKRHAGSHAIWLGVLIIVPLGLCIVPRSKLLRAAQTINRALAGRCTFAEYRSLCGLLEHLRGVIQKSRNVMFGLYEPHGPLGASRHGPDARVHCSILMRKQLLRWRNMLSSAGGISVRRAVLRHETSPSPTLLIALCSDACLGDNDPPGIGGFCHGFFWFFPIPHEHTDLVNIPLLEFLAVCGNILNFYTYLANSVGENVHALFRTDALTTAITLPKQSQKSLLLMHAFSELLRTTEFRHIRKYAHCRHLFGEANPFSDRISRSKWKEFHLLCRQVKIRPERLPLTPSFNLLYHSVIRFAAQTRGVSGGCYRSFVDALRAQDTAGSLLLLAESSPAAASDTKPDRQPVASTASPFRLPPPPPARANRPASDLTKASAAVAVAKAVEITSAGPPDMQLRAGPSIVAPVAAAADGITNYGVKPGTAAKDDRAWTFWTRVCEHFGTAPIRSAQDVRDHPSRITFLLTSLMIYARMYCKPFRPGAAFITPSSCLAYPLAIIRIYKRWGIPLPGYKQLALCLQGMCRAYAAHHGPDSLTPHKAEPFKFQMSRALFDIPDGTRVNGCDWSDNDPKIFTLKRANLFAMSSGARLASLMALKRANVSFTLQNTVYTDPTAEQLENMQSGDTIDVSPAPGKCDEWLEVHAHFPYCFVYRQDRYNVAAAVRDIELRSPCHGAARHSTALFGDKNGLAYPRSAFCEWLRSALSHLYGRQVASLYTWHSYRSGYATALHAAGVPDEVILLLCHWVSSESLRSYRRLSHAEQEAAMDAASKVNITTLQPRNAPVVCGDQHYAALLAELTPSRTERNRTPRSRFEHSGDSLSDAQRRSRQRVSRNANSSDTQPPRSDPPDNSDPTSPFAAASGTDAPLGPPLSSTPLPGTKVIIPRSVWPAYPCVEHGSQGWEAVVRSATSKTALLRFVRAATPSGRPYKDIRLPLDALRQPPQGSTTTVPYIRGGCRAGAARPGADALMPPPQAGAPNDLRYPQLVPSDTCALCKRQLPPLNRSPNPDWLLPTAVATPERLQCERCKRVRYCSAWCAHMHYEAAHKYLCPLPPFSSEFNACYVIRSGRRVRSFPVRCIARGETSINPELHQAARGYAWTAVRHETDPTRAKCDWCLRGPPT